MECDSAVHGEDAAMHAHAEETADDMMDAAPSESPQLGAAAHNSMAEGKAAQAQPMDTAADNEEPCGKPLHAADSEEQNVQQLTQKTHEIMEVYAEAAHMCMEEDQRGDAAESDSKDQAAETGHSIPAAYEAETLQGQSHQADKIASSQGVHEDAEHESDEQTDKVATQQADTTDEEMPDAQPEEQHSSEDIDPPHENDADANAKSEANTGSKLGQQNVIDQQDKDHSHVSGPDAEQQDQQQKPDRAADGERELPEHAGDIDGRHKDALLQHCKDTQMGATTDMNQRAAKDFKNLGDSPVDSTAQLNQLEIAKANDAEPATAPPQVSKQMPASMLQGSQIPGSGSEAAAWDMMEAEAKADNAVFGIIQNHSKEGQFGFQPGLGDSPVKSPCTPAATLPHTASQTSGIPRMRPQANTAKTPSSPSAQPQPLAALPVTQQGDDATVGKQAPVTKDFSFPAPAKASAPTAADGGNPSGTFQSRLFSQIRPKQDPRAQHMPQSPKGSPALPPGLSTAHDNTQQTAKPNRAIPGLRTALKNPVQGALSGNLRKSSAQAPPKSLEPQRTNQGSQPPHKQVCIVCSQVQSSVSLHDGQYCCKLLSACL